MERSEALNLVKQEIKNKNLVKHSLAVEACMRDLARKLGEDDTQWALAGLLHDLDYEYTANDPANHTLKTAEMLQNSDVSADILHAIKAHNAKVPMESKMDIALFTIDPTTGFIIACALMHPSKKLSAVDLPRMKKRFGEKNFAKGAGREQMMESRKLGLELDEFLSLCLTAMQGINNELGL